LWDNRCAPGWVKDWVTSDMGVATYAGERAARRLIAPLAVVAAALVLVPGLALARAWRTDLVDLRAGSALNGVSCPSARVCVAVGTDSRSAFAERYDGAWHREFLRYPASSVSCRLGWCVAVGGFVDQLASERWDGMRWVARGLPGPGAGFGLYGDYLTSLSCATPRACIAVGSTTALTDLSCPPGITPRCTTVVPLVERLTGRNWRLETLPEPVVAVQSVPRNGNGPFVILNSVSCTSRGWCMSVGYWGLSSAEGPTPPANVHLFADRWDGHRWTLYLLANPPHARYLFSEAVSCTFADACTLVAAIGDRTMRLLAERWNGRRWTFEHLTMPAGAHSASLTAISCSARRWCTAVGSASGRGGVSRPLVETWNGAGWRTVSSPPPPRSASIGGSALSGVSCVASSCMAVGNYGKPDQNEAGWFIERYS
jgi:hypothetical protein